MDEFSFRGRDIGQFRALAAFGASMRVGAKIKRSEYELPGGGSVIIGEDTWLSTQRQVTIIPADGADPSPKWRRDILAWLQGGRGELVVHNDPDVIRIAQFDQDGTWGTEGWPTGAIALTMTLQPLAYARFETGTTALSSGGAASVPISTQSALPMPLRILAEVKSGTLNALTLRAGGSTLSLAGMRLTVGQKILYDAGSMIGDMMSLVIADAQGYASVTHWGKLTAMPGGKLEATGSGGEYTLTAVCRGRWPA